jgi:hypothetical protein
VLVFSGFITWHVLVSCVNVDLIRVRVSLLYLETLHICFFVSFAISVYDFFVSLPCS